MRCVLLLCLCLGWGCESDFPSRSIIEDYRLLGVVADAPEIAPDGQVQLQAWDVEPADGPVTYAWSLCLWSFGVGSGYACVDPAFETALPTDAARVSLDFSAQGVDFETFYATHGPYFDSNGDPLTLEDGVDVWVHLTAQPASGRAVRAVKRIRLRAGAPTNTNPTITAIHADRQADHVALRVELAPGAAEAYRDPLDGTERTESLLYTWYATAGEFDPPITFGATRETVLRVPRAVADLRIFVAVRDGRGGLAVAEAP